MKQSIPTPLQSQRPNPILLAVTGMSPAILTETVWALAQEQPPVLPSRVIVITTKRGRDAIIQRLLTPLPLFNNQSAWDTLRSALKAQGHDLDGRLQFGDTHGDIRIMTTLERATSRTVEMSDIRTAQENEAAADYLLDQVRTIVENVDQQLIASLAGGRKTMGALLYACMNLAARETDRLTHVLVNEPFDTLPDFFFPGQPGGRILSRQQTAFEPDQARLELADVPFVPLRNLFVRELNRKAGTFSRLVDSCREGIRLHAAEKVRLTVDTARPRIEVNGSVIHLTPREHLILLFLARRAKAGETALSSYKMALDPLDAFRAQLYMEPKVSREHDWRCSPGMNESLADDDTDSLRKLLDSIKTKLKEAGGDALYLAHCLPEKGRFSLDIPASMIFIK
jgi:CRISPR-associated protein (TIGR02584 family)